MKPFDQGTDRVPKRTAIAKSAGLRRDNPRCKPASARSADTGPPTLREPIRGRIVSVLDIDTSNSLR